MRTPVRRRTSRHSSSLRRNATDAERLLWGALRDRWLFGYKFRFQATIEPFVMDFLCVEARLIVEVDGSQHGEDVNAARSQFLQRRNYRVLRFWNNEVLENRDGVLDVIAAALEQPTSAWPKEKKTLTQPSPASGRGLERRPLTHPASRSPPTRWRALAVPS